MKPKYILCGFLAFSVVIGWNAFLAKRDAELFKAYDHPTLSCESKDNCKMK